MTSISFETLLQMLFLSCGTICTGGAFLLLLRPKGHRSQRLLGLIMLFWGLMYLVRAAGVLTGFIDYVEPDIISPFILIAGNLSAIVLLVYPVEVLRPGWLNMRRFAWILLPYLSIVAFYYVVMALLGQQPQPLYSAADVMANITRFNVWFRFVIVLSVMFYISALILLVYKYEVSYRRWCNDNYSSTDEMDISWLRYFGAGSIAITVAYFVIVFFSQMWCVALHNVTVQVVFVYTVYFGLFHKNPYPEDFFQRTMQEDELGLLLKRKPRSTPVHSTESVDENPVSAAFDSRLPEYIETLTKWFYETRPYLRPDFKLMDISSILPVNRSYLSRIFNMGMGDTFINVVRNYRMGEVRRLLTEQPDLSIAEIADRCGFNSTTSLHRTFVQYHSGLTPGQFREQFRSGINKPETPKRPTDRLPD